MRGAEKMGEIPSTGEVYPEVKRPSRAAGRKRSGQPANMKRVAKWQALRHWEQHRHALKRSEMHGAARIFASRWRGNLDWATPPHLEAQSFRCRYTLAFIQVVILACCIRRHSHLHISHEQMAGIIGCHPRTCYTASEEAAAAGWVDKTEMFEGAPFEGYKGRNGPEDKALRHRQVPNAYAPGHLLLRCWQNRQAWQSFYKGGPAPPHHNNKDRSESDPSPDLQEQVYKRPHRRRSKDTLLGLRCRGDRRNGGAGLVEQSPAAVIAEALAQVEALVPAAPAVDATALLAAAAASAPLEAPEPAQVVTMEAAPQARGEDAASLDPGPASAEPATASPEPPTSRRLIGRESKGRAEGGRPAARPASWCGTFAHVQSGTQPDWTGPDGTVVCQRPATAAERKPVPVLARPAAPPPPPIRRPVIRPFEHDGALPPWYLDELRKTDCKPAGLRQVLERAELHLRLTAEGRPPEAVAAAVEALRARQGGGT
jgi:hypothetical protein